MGSENGKHLPATKAGNRIKYYLGTAGWNFPKTAEKEFPAEGPVLTRYAHRLNAVEINSSFYRLHRPETYARWASITPPEFRFAVKLPRAITHFSALRDFETLLRFHEGTLALGEKLGVWLVQLPPKLVFEAESVRSFFERVRRLYEGPVVCEPRHPSWFTAAAEPLLHSLRIGRVAAHPAPHPQGEEPAAWQEIAYYRLHGAPHRYVSAYPPEFLSALAERIRSHPTAREVWILFNNTAAGAAVENALQMQRLLWEAGEQNPSA